MQIDKYAQYILSSDEMGSLLSIDELQYLQKLSSGEWADLDIMRC
jgi:hypothetical protein